MRNCQRHGNGEIIGFCDADWANNIDDRKSCSGYVFIFQGGAMSWMSKRQATIALSTTEAEYISLATAGQESLLLRSFFNQFDIDGSQQSIGIRCDNMSALDLALSNGYSARTKHIDLRHHFIR